MAGSAPPDVAAAHVGARTLLGVSLFWMALSFLSDGLVTLVLPAQLATRGTTSPQVLGLVGFLGLLAGMLIQPLAGAVSDRLRPNTGRTPVLLVGTAGVAVALALLAGARSAAAVAASFALVHVGAAVAQAAQQAYVPDIVPARQRGLAGGLKGLMDVGGAALGFVVLGGVVEARGADAAILAVGLVVVASAVATRALVREPSTAGPPVPRITLAGLARLDRRKDRPFLLAMAARFLFLLGTFAVGRFLFLFIEDQVLPGRDSVAAEVGGVLGILALLTALSSPLAGWVADRRGRHPVMVVGCALSAVGVVLLGLATTLGAVMAFGSLMALGSAAFTAASWAWLTDTSRAGEAGRYLGLAHLATGGAAAVAGLLGALIDRGDMGGGGGYGALFLACGLLFAASASIVVVNQVTSSTARKTPDRKEAGRER